jgi:hypothetical protein
MSKTAVGPTKGIPGFLPGDDAARRDVDHLCPSTAYVKNEWSYISTPAVCLHGGNRANLPVYFRPYTGPSPDAGNIAK